MPLDKSRRMTGAERLDALRHELAKHGCDGFLVPRADEHQGEYVPARAERLAWLTGFTGSAGLAIVLKDKAAIFVDGRYTLQVRAEVEEKLFAPLHLIEESPSDWIAKNLGKGRKLGYDPWLHTESQLETLQKAAARAGGELMALEANPLDAVWSDQPPVPLGTIEPHSLEFAGKASSEKRSELAVALSEAGADAVVLTLPDSIAWLLNVRGSDVPHTPFALSFALADVEGRVDWFVHPEKLSTELRRELGNGIVPRHPEELAGMLDGLSGRRVLIDPSSAAGWFFRKLEVAGAEIIRADDPCQLPKAKKNETELAGTRAAHRRDGVAVTRFLHWLSTAAPGITEMEAAEKLLGMRRTGEHFKDLSFDTIAGSGPNGAIVHYRVNAKSDRRLGDGELFLLDSGGQYRDGTTDITRTVAIGVSSPEMRRRFTLVLKGHIALATARFPEGTSGSQLDALARLPLWREGLDYDHGTGHGVGSYLSVHEGPQRIAKVPNRTALQPGMILSNEPGYYKSGAYGIRIENLVVVRPSPRHEGEERAMLEFETLTLAPIDRRLVDISLLDEGERAWLDAYHARVLTEIAPALDLETLAWLEAACAPL